MCYILMLFYVLIVLCLQVVFVPRIFGFGITADLLLVSVIVFSVLNKRNESLFFAAALGLLADILSVGPYYNTVLYVLGALCVHLFKANYSGEENNLVYLSVLALTPALILIQFLFFAFILGREISWLFLVFGMLFATVLNLLAALLITPIVRRFSLDTAG